MVSPTILTTSYITPVCNLLLLHSYHQPPLTTSYITPVWSLLLLHWYHPQSLTTSCMTPVWRLRLLPWYNPPTLTTSYITPVWSLLLPPYINHHLTPTSYITLIWSLIYLEFTAPKTRSHIMCCLSVYFEKNNNITMIGVWLLRLFIVLYTNTKWHFASMNVDATTWTCIWYLRHLHVTILTQTSVAFVSASGLFLSLPHLLPFTILLKVVVL